MLTEQQILDPTSDPTSDPGSVRVAMENVRIQLQAAQALLDSGRSVDLTGMDATMGILCNQALALPPPLARQTLPDLMALRDTVEALITTLATRPRPLPRALPRSWP